MGQNPPSCLSEKMLLCRAQGNSVQECPARILGENVSLEPLSERHVEKMSNRDLKMRAGGERCGDAQEHGSLL